jgi:hypothetical protein
MRFNPFGFMKQSAVPSPAPVRKFTYIATGGSRVKNMKEFEATYNGTIGDGAIIFGGCTPPFLPLYCFSTSANATDTTEFNSLLVGTSFSVVVQRNLRMDGSPTGLLNSWKAEIFVNNVLITSQSNSTPTVIPITGSGNLIQSFTFGGIIVNDGDIFEMKWTDNIAS